MKPAVWSRALVVGSLVSAFAFGLAYEASSQAQGQPAAAPKAAAKKGAKKPAAKPGADAGAEAAVNLRPTQESEIWTGTPDAGVVATYVPPPPRKVSPPPPPPTPEQLKGLQQLQVEATEYEKSAKDYRDAITRIVQHHYEDKRRRLLASLDGEIEVEKKSLREVLDDMGETDKPSGKEPGK